MPTGLPNIPLAGLQGFVTQVETGFVQALQRKLTATQFFEYTPTNDISIQSIDWREISDQANNVRITMEIPTLEAQDGSNITKKSLEIPLFTKDLTYGGRAWNAYKRAGLDVEDARQAGRIMAEEINDYLYFGANGAALPGPATGLLNNVDIASHTDAYAATTNWTVVDDMVNSINASITKLLVDEHQGPFVLLMNPADSDLFNRFRAVGGGDRQAIDYLPSLVRGPFYDKAVATNTAYLFEPGRDNFDAVGPFSPGEVRTFSDDPGEAGLMMGKQIWIRHMSGIAPRVKRTSAIRKLTFDRA